MLAAAVRGISPDWSNMERFAIVLISLLIAAPTTFAPGCATSRSIEKKAETPAERLYLIGERRMERSDYKGAIEKFDEVRNDHPYSRFAALADLRIADAHFEQQEYSSALEQYRTFVKLHPDHAKVPYARYRMGKSLYEKMPDNWFFMPPAHERDLSSTRRATRQLQKFIDKHPESSHVEEARELLADARRRLADHEMYVATFYLERDNARAAERRLEHLLQNYSGLGLDPKALFLLGKARHLRGEQARAVEALRDLLEYHGDSRYARRARRFADRHGLELSG